MNREELRKEILKRMYDKGYRYIAKNEDGNVHVYKTLPEKKCSYWTNWDLYIRLHFFIELFEDIQFQDEKPLSIAEELGLINWSQVPVDTKVLVSRDGEYWTKRYFNEYRKNSAQPFVVYADGVTSWSAAYDGNIAKYEYCKLVEEEE